MLISTCQKRYQFLNNLTQGEKEVIEDAKRHRLREVTISEKLLRG